MIFIAIRSSVFFFLFSLEVVFSDNCILRHGMTSQQRENREHTQINQFLTKTVLMF